MTFCDWLAARLGTRKWVVARRMTDKLREKGYECCVSPARFATLRKVYEAGEKP